MPAKLVLHIGTMKTGSTTVQSLLMKHRAWLLSRGVSYPATYSDLTHILFALMFTSYPNAYQDFGNSLWQGKDPKSYLSDVREKFREEMRCLPSHVGLVIISSELFSQFVRKQSDIQRLHDFLKEFFDEITVLVYLRRQDGHASSSYSQQLRGGRLQLPSLMKLNDDKHIYDYAALLDAWSSVFGPQAMRPRVFERDTDKSFDVVADFVAQTGIGPLPDSQSGGAERNPSMNAAGQHMLREIGSVLRKEEGQQFARSAMWKHLVHVVTETLPGQGWRPTRSEAQAFVSRFAVSNEAVRARWFPERPALFSDDFSRLPVEVPDLNEKEVSEAAYKVVLAVARDRMTSAYEKAKSRLESEARPPESRRLMKLLRLNPADIEIRLKLAELQVEEGAEDAARFNIRQVLRRSPKNDRAQALLELLDEKTGRDTSGSATGKEPAIPLG